MRRHSGLLLALIIGLAVLAGFFVYPRGPVGDWRPWRLGLDLVGGSHLVYEVDLSEVPAGDRESVLNGLRDVIERRVNLFGVSEPQVYLASTGDRSELIVELAGIRDVDEAISEIGETPFLDFREMEETGTSTAIFTNTELTGRYITGARLGFTQTIQEPQVELSFNEEGGRIFEQLTEKNVGKRLAIFLDNEIISAPVVQQKISGGQAVITGVTLDEAKEMVKRFNAGALPAPIRLIDQLTVSPSLGTDSMEKGIVAGIAGTLLVILFMIVYYRGLGVFASIALVMYVAFTLAVFKLIPITLTLAGLAGFILTIGMAVDANILIFERVNEERRKGLGGSAALAEGFRRAWPSIRDSNTSTIITAVILYFFTASFVKGFALTLLVGVLVSMFSAITTTRLLLNAFLKHKTAKI